MESITYPNQGVNYKKVAYPLTLAPLIQWSCSFLGH